MDPNGSIMMMKRSMMVVMMMMMSRKNPNISFGILSAGILSVGIYSAHHDDLWMISGHNGHLFHQNIIWNLDEFLGSFRIRNISL